MGLQRLFNCPILHIFQKTHLKKLEIKLPKGDENERKNILKSTTSVSKPELSNKNATSILTESIDF